MHVDEKWVIQLAEDPPLVEDRLDVVLLDNSASEGKYFFLEISFIAHSLRLSFAHTFHTRPNPPNPIW